MNQPSPFHSGEITIQERVGARESVRKRESKMIRDFLPPQHREFYPMLPLLFVGSIDGQQRPWASVLWGQPGFLSSPDEHHLAVRARPAKGDPLEKNLRLYAPLGLLGIEYHSRRRNRMNGTVSEVSSEGFSVKVSQTFGNCPAYIQAQLFQFDTQRTAPTHEPEPLSRLQPEHETFIDTARSFYIASAHSFDPKHPASGVDVSHRGGSPGFVLRTSSKQILFPDFKGNNHFNTLGNLLANPKTGIVFLDFTTGHLLSLTGSAEILWDDPRIEQFRGAERLVRFTLDEGVFLRNAIPLRWHHLEDAPQLARLGNWQEVAMGKAEHEQA